LIDIIRTSARLRVALLVGALLAAVVPMTFVGAVSGQIPGNSTCKKLLADETAQEIKVDVSDLANAAKFGPVTITGLNAGKTLMGFTSTTRVSAVFVKGGPDGGYLYDYRLPNPPGGSLGDTNMGTNGYGAGRHQISHVSFCWNQPPRVPLTASKTAKATYDKTITWELTKTVDPKTHSGIAGEKAGESKWTVKAKKIVTLGNYKVTGKITINNANTFGVPVTVTDQLNDGTPATVACDGTGNATGTAPAKGSLVCHYAAKPTGSAATKNNATVTPSAEYSDLAPNPQPHADLVWEVTTIGFEKAQLVDTPATGLPDGVPPIDKIVTGDHEEVFYEDFWCPADRSVYDATGKHTYVRTNTAYLKGPNTNLSASDSVTVHCTYPQEWKGETATGQGPRYPGSSNWFMYTPYTTAKVDLIAGQKYDAGDVLMKRVGSSTEITIKLHDGFRFAAVSANLKIQHFASAPTSYLSPGRFAHKFDVAQSKREITVVVPTADFYGIHADVQRLVS
jgi:hypothetical protein